MPDTFKSMAPLQETLLHAVFCACHYGAVAGAIAPIPLAIPPLLLMYLFFRFWNAWQYTVWALGVYAVDVGFAIAVGVLSALIALHLRPEPALLSSPLVGAMLLLFATVLTLLPVYGRHVLSVLLKIWIVGPLTVAAAALAYVLTRNPVFVLVVALEGTLFLCTLLGVFLGGAAEMATCTLCGVAGLVHPLSGALFVLILVVWFLISRAAHG